MTPVKSKSHVWKLKAHHSELFAVHIHPTARFTARSQSLR